MDNSFSFWFWFILIGAIFGWICMLIELGSLIYLFRRRRKKRREAREILDRFEKFAFEDPTPKIPHPIPMPEVEDPKSDD